MAFSFGDSFDLYATNADLANGYWDSAPNANLLGLGAGRFAGSRSISGTALSSIYLMKNGANDAVHHLVVAFNTTVLSGTTLGFSLQLLDGATAQCSIVFRADGVILLNSGAPLSGTTLATYTGGVTTINTWYAFEFEVVIHPTAGSFTVRKNGNNVADFTATSLNTRPTSSNNYANRLQVGGNATISTQFLDDLFWQSGAATGAWLGDIRCYARMPASDASVTFSRSTGASNFSCVDEAQQNALTDYVFDANPGDADFYGVASIASTPASVIATTVRAYAQKSDAGTRTMAVQLKSGATTVASPTLVLTSSGWLWAWRTDLVDPATGAAWTPAAVNNAQIGPKTIA
jgi:hypothetical protein